MALTALPLLPTALPLAVDAAPLLSPILILVLCVAAGIGTILLLPGRFTVAWHRIGGALLFAAAVFFGIALFVSADDRPSVYFWIFAAISLVGSVRVVTHDKPVYSALYFVLTVFSTAGLFVLLYAEFMAVALITIYAGAILVTYTFVIMLAADAAPAGKRPEDAAKEFLAEFDARSRAPWSAGAVGFLLMGVLLFVIFDRAPQTLLPRMSLTDAKYLTPIEAGARPTSEMGAETAGGELAQGPAAADVGVAAAEADVVRGDLYSSENRVGYSGEVGRGGIQVLGIYLFTRQMVALQIAGLILTVAMVGAIVIARKQVIPDLQPEEMLDVGDGQTMTMPHTPVEDNPHSLIVTATGNPRQKAYPQN